MGVLPASAWKKENFYLEFDNRDIDLLETLEVPEHLDSLDLDDDEVWDALVEAFDKDLLFLLEQSCDLSGRLLLPDMRRTRLKNIPLEHFWRLDRFISETDPCVLDQVAYFVFWLVRFERLRRTGSPELRI